MFVTHDCPLRLCGRTARKKKGEGLSLPFSATLSSTSPARSGALPHSLHSANSISKDAFT